VQLLHEQRFNAFQLSLADEDLAMAPQVQKGINMRGTSPERSTYRDITPAHAHAARGNARLIDVRETSELAADGFIEGVEHVPLGRVAEAARRWNTDDELVIVCRSGARSAAAASALCAMGFQRVSNMAGGMLAYKAAGLPVRRA
jgi:sulfur-carrier protein adenylyltransferase/sulfurtransferase